MSKAKTRQANFEQTLEALRAGGFETAPSAAVEGGVLVTRQGIGAVLAPGETGTTVVEGAGRMIAGELSRLEDRGYQKFMRTSQSAWPATAQDLHAIHGFSEELRQRIGAAGLFNESLGTNSDCYRYDRLQGRS